MVEGLHDLIYVENQECFERSRGMPKTDALSAQNYLQWVTSRNLI